MGLWSLVLSLAPIVMVSSGQGVCVENAVFFSSWTKDEDVQNRP